MGVNDSSQSVRSRHSSRCTCGFATSPGLLALAAVLDSLGNAIRSAFHTVRQGLQAIASCFGAGGIVDSAPDATASCSNHASYGAGYTTDCGAELWVLSVLYPGVCIAPSYTTHRASHGSDGTCHSFLRHAAGIGIRFVQLAIDVPSDLFGAFLDICMWIGGCEMREGTIEWPTYLVSEVLLCTYLGTSGCACRSASCVHVDADTVRHVLCSPKLSTVGDHSVS